MALARAYKFACNGALTVLTELDCKLVVIILFLEMMKVF